MSETKDLENRDSGEAEILMRYWRTNVFIMAVLLLIWAFLSLGCSILFADSLNRFSLFGSGYPLGFWFAQQGSILGFVVIILVYALFMNRTDTKHHRELVSVRKADQESVGL